MGEQQGRTITRIDKLAETLREDMHRRSLREGDAYLTAAEAGRMLGVSQVMANRAMNVLAGRRLVIRHRRRGTFVGPGFRPGTPKALRVIHVFKGLSRDERQWSRVIGDCLHGLHKTFPGYQVQSNLLPPHNPAELVRQVFEQFTPDGTLSGVVLLSCPREVQEVAQTLSREHDVPAVSFGTLYPNITSVPSVDHDQFESGRLMAEYLTARGHRRMMLLMKEHWLPGDNRMLSGINRALADAKLYYGALSTRAIPEVATLARTEIAPLLSEDDRPTGIIARSPMFAEAALEVARARAMRVPEDLEIIFEANDRSFSADLGLPRACAVHSSGEQLTLVAETLEKLISGEPIEKMRMVLPSELVQPEENG